MDAFVLSQIDGSSTIDDLVSLVGLAIEELSLVIGRLEAAGAVELVQAKGRDREKPKRASREAVSVDVFESRGPRKKPAGAQPRMNRIASSHSRAPEPRPAPPPPLVPARDAAGARGERLPPPAEKIAERPRTADAQRPPTPPPPPAPSWPPVPAPSWPPVPTPLASAPRHDSVPPSDRVPSLPPLGTSPSVPPPGEARARPSVPPRARIRIDLDLENESFSRSAAPVRVAEEAVAPAPAPSAPDVKPKGGAQEGRDHARVFVEAAEEALERGNVVAAAAQFQLALACSDSLEIRRAFEAVEVLAKPIRFETFKKQGEVAEKAERWADAAAAYTKAHAAKSDARVGERLANALRLSGGDLRLAAKLAEEAVQKEPTSAGFHATLAEVYADAGLDVRAQGEIKRALELASDEPRARALQEKLAKAR
jgi:hypothetical protein